MPFDAAGYPKDDGASPTEPTPEPLWLRCFAAAMVFAGVVLLVGGLWGVLLGTAWWVAH